MRKIDINGETYIHQDDCAANALPTSGRAVVVLDRGWIFAGDVHDEGNGFIRLMNAVHVFAWESIGFAKMVETQKADLRPVADVVYRIESEIFRVPVPEKWGLK